MKLKMKFEAISTYDITSCCCRTNFTLRFKFAAEHGVILIPKSRYRKQDDNMKKIIVLIMLLISVAVVASNKQLRSYVVSQFRSIIEPLFEHGEATEPQFDSFYAAMVEELPIQARAERALELSINRFVGASNYIMDNAQDWRGEMKRNQKLTTLIDTAINSPLIEIRMAGFEIYLAQFDLEKSVEQVDNLLIRFEKNPEGSGPWVMWSMALIGARGVDRERIFDELLIATENPNDKIRRWAVDALARFGGEEVIGPLLDIASNDFSPIIQERAYCGLAQTGTLHVLERYSALPRLLEIAKDPQSSDQTLSWVYQALKEISNFYDIPNDPRKWQKRLIQVDMIQK